MTDVEAPLTRKDDASHALRYGIPVNYRWLVELVLLPLIMTGGGLWLTSINARIAELDAKIQEIQIAARGDQTNIENMESQLKRIENKLDKAISIQSIQ